LLGSVEDGLGILGDVLEGFTPKLNVGLIVLSDGVVLGLSSGLVRVGGDVNKLVVEEGAF